MKKYFCVRRVAHITHTPSWKKKFSSRIIDTKNIFVDTKKIFSSQHHTKKYFVMIKKNFHHASHVLSLARARERARAKNILCFTHALRACLHQNFRPLHHTYTHTTPYRSGRGNTRAIYNIHTHPPRHPFIHPSAIPHRELLPLTREVGKDPLFGPFPRCLDPRTPGEGPKQHVCACRAHILATWFSRAKNMCEKKIKNIFFSRAITRARVWAHHTSRTNASTKIFFVTRTCVLCVTHHHSRARVWCVRKNIFFSRRVSTRHEKFFVSRARARKKNL